MEHNGRLQMLSPAASDEETAAIVAAVERFIRATIQPPAGPAPGVDPWCRAALLEGISRDAGSDIREPWINK
jgi:hypothetical protein